MKFAGGPFNRKNRPSKPYPEFPLFPHAAGVWAKKIRGRFVYFGPWDDPDAALEKYLKQKDFLHAGQLPPPEADSVTLDELANRFLASKLLASEACEITKRQYFDYRRDCKRLLEILGRKRPVESLQPADFGRLRTALGKGRNATTLANIVIRIRSVFRWGERTMLLSRQPNYGGEFSRPSARALRKALSGNGSKCLTADEILALLDASESHMNLHAMILLGINAALGNTDCAELRLDHIDLKAGVLAFPRPKTGVQRRAMLWPQTVKAIRKAVRLNKTNSPPKKLSDRVFVTRRKEPYMHMTEKGTVVDSIGLQFRRLLVSCGIERRGIGFYALRHTFRTVADETKDFPAIDLVMGHIASDSGAPFAAEMGARYRGRIGDDRLRVIADHVGGWLFG